MANRLRIAVALASIAYGRQAGEADDVVDFSPAFFDSDLLGKMPHEDAELFMHDELVHADDYGEWVHSPEVQQMIRGRRNLNVLYTTTDSYKCRQCISNQNVFCLNSTHDNGTCCGSSTGCTEVDVCSYMVP